MNPRRQWIIGFEGPLHFTEIMTCFREGDTVLILSQNASSDKGSTPKERSWVNHVKGDSNEIFIKILCKFLLNRFYYKK